MKKLLLSAGALAIALSAFAAIDIQVPQVELSSYAMINAEGINLRQWPSTSSDKLIWQCMDDSDECWYDFAPSGNAEHPTLGTIHPLIDTEGDWAFLYYTGYMGQIIPVWTKKDFLKILPAPGPMTDEEKEKLYVYDLPAMPGYALVFVDEGMGEQALGIGKKSGDQYIFTHFISMPTYNEDQTNPLEITEYDWGTAISFNPSLATSKKFEWEDGETYIETGYFNPTALTKEQIELLFDKKCREPIEYIVLSNKYGNYTLFGS